MARTKKDQRKTYSAGERGRNRVRVFPDRRTGLFQMEWRESGKRCQRSLGHHDWALAKKQADEFAARYVAPKPATDAEPEPLTLRRLFEMYLGKKTPEKSAAVQRFDGAAALRLREHIGSHMQAGSLNEDHWDHFIEARRAGGAGPRTIARDLKFLLAVLNWATKRSDSQGRALLERNPLKGYAVPVEGNPRRPVLSENEYLALLGVADSVSPMLKTLLILAHETGHRVGAIRSLQWSDVDWTGCSILWRAENDKLDFEHRTPMTQQTVEALGVYRSRNPTIRLPHVFPSPGDGTRPVSRHLLRDWWRRAEVLAELGRVEGRGWHSLRRKFATDLMDRPLKVLSSLGGWKGTETIVECYQHPSQELLRQELEGRRRVANGTE